MSSHASSFTNKSRVAHTIRTTKNIDLQPIEYTRTVAAGQSTSGAFKVQSYYAESARDWIIPVQAVDTYEEYIAGCKEHERCLGHYCSTPRGSTLLPQRLASTLGIMSNDYAKMAENIFMRDSPSQEEKYREKLRSMMLKKSGKMRGDMPSGPVDGSARLVISQFWQTMDCSHLEVSKEQLADLQLSQVEPIFFAVLKMVAKNMRVLKVQDDKETGLPLGFYTEDRVREGDWFIVVRAPSLGPHSVQPMIVVLWEHECFGLDPSRADEYHADFDGDEMHGYFMGRPDSIQQCKKWKPLTPCKFTQAIDSTYLPESCRKEGSMDIRSKFMVHSTVSIRELMDGVQLPSISKASRMKEAMANMCVERLNNPDKVFNDFIKESIRGMKDVMAQQLHQGYIGDMSRQAKLAATCVKYKGKGVFLIAASTDTRRIINLDIAHIDYDIKFPLGGNPCLRAISAICAKAQQAMLDAHRVSQEVSSKMNLADNFIRGDRTSLVAFMSGSLPKHSWKSVEGSTTFCIVENDEVKSYANRVIAAYNPTVLKVVKLLNRDVKEVCRNGISMVCNYYGITLSTLELYSLAELLCYRCDAGHHPITTKQGIQRRDLRWMVVTFANHYGMLKSLQKRGLTKKPVRPEVITDAACFCNFDYV